MHYRLVYWYRRSPLPFLPTSYQTTHHGAGLLVQERVLRHRRSPTKWYPKWVCRVVKPLLNIFIPIFIFGSVLVLSSPAWPYWPKSGVNRLSRPPFIVNFSKRPFYGQSSNYWIHLFIALNLSGSSKIGSFLIIVLKLYCYKDSDVGNFRKMKYFRNYFRPSHKTWNTI